MPAGVVPRGPSGETTLASRELYATVRRAVVEKGLSHREAGRRFGIDRQTVGKMLSYSAPPGYRRTKPVRRSKLEGLAGIIDADRDA